MAHNYIRKAFLVLGILWAAAATAQEREPIWPKGKMPDPQPHQIAAMTDEAGKPGFKADRHRTPYLEWFEAPADIEMTPILSGSKPLFPASLRTTLTALWPSSQALW